MFRTCIDLRQRRPSGFVGCLRHRLAHRGVQACALHALELFVKDAPASNNADLDFIQDATQVFLVFKAKSTSLTTSLCPSGDRPDGSDGLSDPVLISLTVIVVAVVLAVAMLAARRFHSHWDRHDEAIIATKSMVANTDIPFAAVAEPATQKNNKQCNISYSPLCSLFCAPPCH